MNLSAGNGLATITSSTWDLARSIRNDGTTTTLLFLGIGHQKIPQVERQYTM